MTKFWYTRREAAELMSVSERSVDLLRESGRLPERRIGRAIRIPAEAIAEFMSQDQSKIRGTVAA